MKRFWNWRLWSGFGLSLVGLVGYVVLFSLTYEVLWPLVPSVLLLAVAAMLLISGLRRAFREPQSYRGKVSGPILSILAVVVLAAFIFVTHATYKAVPSARNAPKVGQHAPEFVLVDSRGQKTSLAQMLAAPITDSTGATRATKGVLVVFYRGYW
jgi:fumarate reductase subunit C